MVTTRSASKAHTATTTSKQTSNISRKRAATNPAPPSPPGKKQKMPKIDPVESKQATKRPTKAADSSDEPILINRAPVLHLWGAVVARHAYPKLSWSTCVSAGAAIAAICAVAKGKSVGTIESKDSGSKKKKAADEIDFDDELEVMQFHLNLKGAKAYMGTTAESSSDDGLRRKFGDRYDEVKECFVQALKVKGVQDIRKNGFHMYEKFRPNVKPGASGWGRKGELDLERVKSVVEE